MAASNYLAKTATMIAYDNISSKLSYNRKRYFHNLQKTSSETFLPVLPYSLLATQLYVPKLFLVTFTNAM